MFCTFASVSDEIVAGHLYELSKVASSFPKMARKRGWYAVGQFEQSLGPVIISLVLLGH